MPLDLQSLGLSGVDNRTGAFKFPGLPGLPTEIDISLSPTEREELRRLALEGGPIGRIVTFLAGYQLAKMLEVAQTELLSEAHVRAARDKQLQAQSIGWFIDLIERLLSEPLLRKESL